MRHGVSSGTLITAVLMVAAAASGVLGLSLLTDSSPPVRGSEPQVLLLAEGELGAFAEFQEIAGASRVATFDELKALSGAEPAVVVIDSAFATNLRSGALRPLAAGGSAIIGLNIPLSQLNDLTGFEDELRSLNPRFAGQSAVGRPARPGEFYSLIWRTPEGANPAYWGRSQHSVSDGLFEAVVREHKLLVRGLFAENDTQIPLEEYGLD